MKSLNILIKIQIISVMKNMKKLFIVLEPKCSNYIIPSIKIKYYRK